VPEVPLDDAYQRQLTHWRAGLDSGAHRIGWKVGLNPPKVQEALSLSGPVVGHLTSATLLGADGAHSLAGAQAPKAEPEIAIEIGPDKTIAGLGPAIELVDIPALPSGPGDVPEVVATNIFHRAVAIGSSKPVQSPDGAAWTFTVDGQVVSEGDASDYPLADMIHAVADTLDEAGESLDAGDRIIAGALAPPPDVQPGQRLKLDLGSLGSIEVQLTV
jgi:2-keto-4-pentenoate hydratase